MGEEEKVTSETEERPQVLYHASSNRAIQEFEPRKETVLHPDEGPVVFATPSKVEASKFIVKTDDSWANLGAFNGVPYVLCSDRVRFEKNDIGGTIYRLSPDTFSLDAQYSRGTNEWTSRVPVKPIGREDVESGLETMLDLGVQVFFVDKETFQQVQVFEDHGYKIVQHLESENMRRGVNVKQIV